ncbi:hypothetical protein SME38J_19260 [Serratia marcescens]|nr:hypothetical protein SME38J_19260 [Serratia marcescens]
MKKRILLMAVAGVLMTASAAAFAHGYYGHGYYRHGYYYGGPHVVIGVPWGPPPLYYPPPPVVYVTPPPPQTYIEKPPSYAYYCRRPAGYYPQVPRCPDGWMKVVPDVPLSR